MAHPSADPKVYDKFVDIMCNDVSKRAQGSASAQGCAAPMPEGRVGSYEGMGPIAARMGFVPIPLLCLVVRVVGHDVWPTLNMKHSSGWLLCFLLWLVLCQLKVLTGVTLLGYAASRAQPAIPGSPQQEVSKSFADLRAVQRYELYGKRIM